MLAEALLVTLSVQNGPGTDDCLSGARLTKSVERRLKRRVFVEPPEAQLRVAVTFERRDDEVEARIAIASADGTSRGTRSLVTEGHCSRLDDSLALSVALLVDQPPDPEPESAPTPPTTNASGAPEPTPAPTRPKLATSIAIPPEVPAAREPWHLRVGLALATAFRVLPQVRPAGLARLTVEPNGFVPLTLHGEAFTPARAERDEASGARFRLLRFGIAGCPQLLRRAERFVGVCVGQKLSWIEVEGFGFDHDRSDRSLAFALTVGGEARQRLFDPVWLRGYLGGEVPLVRDSFSTGGGTPERLFQASPVAVAGEIGVEVELW